MRLSLIGFLLIACGTIRSQDTAPAFEVASVRPSDPALCKSFAKFDYRHDRFTMTCATLKYIIQWAYDVRTFQVTRGPAWLESIKYDIAAKAPALPDDGKDPSEFTQSERKIKQERFRAMVKSLLADRFQLGLHSETRQMPVYLMMAGRGGPKLTRDDAVTAESGGVRLGRGFLGGSQIELSFLALALSEVVGRPILDRTGLTDKYDFRLRWTPDQSAPNDPFGAPLPNRPDAPSVDSNRPTLVTALQEQLGLQLKSARGPVEILIVDRAEKPGEN